MRCRLAGKPKDVTPLYPDPREASNTIKDGGTLVCEDENMTDDGDDIPTAEVSWDDLSCSAHDIVTAGTRGPGWNDSKTVKAWLERRYHPGHPLLGSPFFRYMKEFYEGSDAPKDGSGYMCGYFSWLERGRWSSETGYAGCWSRDDVPLYSDQEAEDTGTYF